MSINNALPDPIIPQEYDPDTPEYVYSLVSLSNFVETSRAELLWSVLVLYKILLAFAILSASLAWLGHKLGSVFAPCYVIVELFM